MQPIHNRDPEVNARYGEFEKTFFDACGSIGATCYSLLPIFDSMGSSAVFADAVHLTAEGNRRIGRALGLLVDQELALTGGNPKRLEAGRISYVRRQRTGSEGVENESERWLLANEVL